MKKDNKPLNLCCYELREALIDLYINVKVRNDTSINDLTDSKIEDEKEQIRHLDGMEIIEYIKSAIEILVSLKDDDVTSKRIDQSSIQDLSL
jgi:hypothetical protein